LTGQSTFDETRNVTYGKAASLCAPNLGLRRASLFPHILRYLGNYIFTKTFTYLKRYNIFAKSSSIAATSIDLASSSQHYRMFRKFRTRANYSSLKAHRLGPKCNHHVTHINTTCKSITQHFILYGIQVIYCQGDMFRPLLGHLQSLWENRSKSYQYFNALWDPKCLQIALYECEIHVCIYIYIYTHTHTHKHMYFTYIYNTICKHLESHNVLKYI